MKKNLSVDEFYALPKNERAVLVAKDILEQIKVKRYKPHAGSYISDLEVKNDYREGQINERFNDIQHCEVCALGAMLLSSTHLGNKLTFEDVNLDGVYDSSADISDLDHPKVKSLFTKIFTPYQLLMIETAFEGYSNFEGNLWNDKVDYENLTKEQFEKEYSDESAVRVGRDVFGVNLSFSDVKKCQRFYENHSDSRKRLTAICKNIIKNNGKFKP